MKRVTFFEIVIPMMLAAALLTIFVMARPSKSPQITLSIAPTAHLDRCDGAKQVLYAVEDGTIKGCQVVCQ